MKKTPLLNIALSRVIASLGHGDILVIGDAGLPVAPILDQGLDYIVTPDVGRTLDTLLCDRSMDRAELQRAFAAAGRALAQLHHNGFCHGRPALRDMAATWGYAPYPKTATQARQGKKKGRGYPDPCTMRTTRPSPVPWPRCPWQSQGKPQQSPRSGWRRWRHPEP